MIKQQLIILVFIVLLVNPGLSSAETSPPQVLIIHSLNSEKTTIENAINLENSDAVISSLLITQLDQQQFDNYDFIILTSSVDFSINGDQELKLIDFANEGNHTLMVFTPFVDQFGGDLRDKLGMNNVDESFPSEDDEYADWTISLNQSLEDELKDTTYDYSGKLGAVDLLPNVEIIATVISSTSTDEDIGDLEFPLPVVFNATVDKAEIITSTLSIIDSTSGFLNQIPDFFNVLLIKLFNVSFDIHRNQINPAGTNTTDPINTSSNIQNSDATTNENNNVSLPLDISFPVAYLLLLLALMGLIFIRKILSLFRWFGEKIIYAGVLVIGAFYNVQDRILDANDIYLNQSRVELLDYLEYIGQYGSHIRELKSLTKMGTGSLLWHLQVLEDFYFIHKYKINRNTIFVASDFVDTFDQDYKALEMNIQSKYSETLIKELVNLIDQNEISVSELGDLTNVNNRTIRRFLAKLNDHEIVSYIQTSPIVIVIDDKVTIKKLNKGYEMRADYSFSRSGIDVQAI